MCGKKLGHSVFFRLYELSSGSIVTDGHDIATMRLYELRSALGVIPQEPVCFSGTIRSNLDMCEEHIDAGVQHALDACGALDVCGLPETMRDVVRLDTEVQENGSNRSVG